MRVKRKDGALFDARLYVSPLIDAKGHQTGWMTSMTDITEPNRIREQLSASHERFTTVLEGAGRLGVGGGSGSEELLFANKLYRLWFGADARGHLQMVAQAGVPQPAAPRRRDGRRRLLRRPAHRTLTTAGSRERRDLRARRWASGWRCARATCTGSTAAWRRW